MKHANGVQAAAPEITVLILWISVWSYGQVQPSYKELFSTIFLNKGTVVLM